MKTKNFTAEDLLNAIVNMGADPFIIEDEQAQINLHMKANGGKPVESKRESIQRIGKSANVDETIRQINEEATQQAELSMSAMSGMFSEE